MARWSSWGVRLVEAILCGILCSVGATIATASMRYQSVARTLYLALLGLASFVAWLLFNLPLWLDSAHYLLVLPNGFQTCAAISNSTTLQQVGSGAAAAVLGTTTRLVAWLVAHQFGTTTLSVEEALCYGTFSVHRVMLATGLFFLLVAVLAVGLRSTQSPRAEFLHGCWPVKFVVLGALVLFAFVVLDDSVISAYRWIAVIGSVLFVIAQALLLVEFSHSCSLTMVAAVKREQTMRCAWVLLSFLAMLALIALAALFYVLALRRTTSLSCESNSPTAVVVITLFLSLIALLIAIRAYRTPRGGVLPAAVVTAYVAYIIWTGVSPEALRALDCHAMPKQGKYWQQQQQQQQDHGMVEQQQKHDQPMSATTVASLGGYEDQLHAMTARAQRIITLITAFVALAYITARTSVRKQRVATIVDEHGSAVEVVAANDGDLEAAEASHFDASDNHEEAHYVSQVRGDTLVYNATIFHLVFLLASMYISMVITGWNDPRAVHDDAVHSGIHDTTIFTTHTTLAFWIKVATAWLSLALYLWTLAAPNLCSRCRRR